MRRKQSVRRGVWYLGGRRRKRKIKRHKGGAFPLMGLLVAAATPILSEVAKPLLRQLLVVEEEELDERKHITKMTYDYTRNSLTKRTIFPREVRESKQTKFTTKRYD